MSTSFLSCSLTSSLCGWCVSHPLLAFLDMFLIHCCLSKATSSGAVYIFRMGSNSGQWKQKQKIVTVGSAVGYELFGTSLALWENTLVVGSSGGRVDGTL